MNNNLITIATFGNSVEASLAKQLLEAEGILAFIMDDDTVDVKLTNDCCDLDACYCIRLSDKTLLGKYF